MQDLVRFNGGNGVTIWSSRGVALVGNNILDNRNLGLRASGNCSGSTVRGNKIAANDGGDVDLSGSRGIGHGS